MSKTIIYFKHGIGNMIMFSPAIQAMASIDESKKIDICLDSEWNDQRRPMYDEYFKNCPFVNDIINYPKQDIINNYNIWFFTGHAENSSALQKFRQKRIIKLDVPNWRESKLHEIIWYMLHTFNYGYRGEIPKQFSPVSANKILQKENDFKYVGLCDGTFDYRMKGAKQYPYFKQLNDSIKNYYSNVKTVKIGYLNELEDVDADFDFVNKLGYLDNAQLISELDFLITTDSGNMHIADALDVPMLVLFGGSLVSKNAPKSKKSDILKLNLECQPCQGMPGFSECTHHDCMCKMESNLVMSKLRRLLNDIV